jgi:hypothetical protein
MTIDEESANRMLDYDSNGHVSQHDEYSDELIALSAMMMNPALLEDYRRRTRIYPVSVYRKAPWGAFMSGDHCTEYYPHPAEFKKQILPFLRHIPELVELVVQFVGNSFLLFLFEQTQGCSTMSPP